MKHVAEIGSRALICTPSFINTGSGREGGITNRQQRDLSRLLVLFSKQGM
jgi:hypothetical protein